MFDHWDEFFLLAGSAAAVLIGLIFVVISLMSDRPRSSVLAGTRLYMGPVVLMVSFVLALSAAALGAGDRQRLVRISRSSPKSRRRPTNEINPRARPQSAITAVSATEMVRWAWPRQLRYRSKRRLRPSRDSLMLPPHPVTS